MSVAALVDTDRWPLDSAELHRELSDTFSKENIAILPGFIYESAIPALIAECDELAKVAFHTTVNADLEVVAYDQFPSDSVIRSLYEWDPLMEFVAKILGEEKLFRYADPFGALNLAVMAEGDQLGWHFDMTDFVVSLALQPSQAGGEFENAQKLRTSTDENYDDVQSVLSGNADDRVRVEPMHAGTLMIFNGRTSLHKVTPVEGSTLRIVALLAYDTKSGTDSSDELKLSRYGRLPQ